MKKPINVEVTARKNESIDRLLKRFTKKVKKELIIEGVRERAYYEKPSEKRIKLKKRRKAAIDKMNKQKEETN
jgi:small subunit ribosomal protein S21